AMPRGILISNAEFSRTRTGAVEITGTALALGMEFSLASTAMRAGDGRIEDLRATIEAKRLRPPAEGEPAPVAAALPLRSTGSLKLALAGAEASDERPRMLSASLAFADASVDLGSDGVIVLDGDIDASLVEHSEKLEIGRLRLA